ncbi:MAG: 4'-phosphopantetheinyl transferase family protein [Lentihominibacter sp.]
MKVIIIENYRAKAPELTGRELTDYLIGKCLERENAEILRMDGGKPYINGGPCFSVSHSGNLFACGISSDNIGIDIQHRRRVDTGSISRRYFTEEEISRVEEDSDWFFRIWARKEAFAKYTGRGLQQIMAKDGVLDRRDVIFIDRMIGDDCFCSICAGKGSTEYEIQFSGREQDG